LKQLLKEKENQPQAEIGIHTGQEIIHDNPQPTLKLFQSPDREWFENIKQAKEDKSENKIFPGQGQEEECDQKSSHFINNHLGGVFPV